MYAPYLLEYLQGIFTVVLLKIQKQYSLLIDIKKK